RLARQRGDRLFARPHRYLARARGEGARGPRRRRLPRGAVEAARAGAGCDRPLRGDLRGPRRARGPRRRARGPAKGRPAPDVPALHGGRVPAGRRGPPRPAAAICGRRRPAAPSGPVPLTPGVTGVAAAGYVPSSQGASRLQADVTLRIRMPHRAGTLARITAEIGKSGALIGDLTTIHSDSAYSVRDLTIEPSRADVPALARAIEKAVEGARVRVMPDRAVEWHVG